MSHPKGVGPQRSPNFSGHLYLGPNGLTESDQIWYGNTWSRRSVFLGGKLQRPHPYFGDLLHVCTVRETTTKFCMVMKLGVRKILTGSTTNAYKQSVRGS